MSEIATHEYDQLLKRFVACFELSGYSTDTNPFYDGDLAWRQDSDTSVLTKLYSRLCIFAEFLAGKLHFNLAGELQVFSPPFCI